ncbi:MAG: NAD(P)H-hydrate dehydratase [Planctomycetes bacterium]|nr:NAD(P)H-hydrate dehydratase [Planctomycetota bacterium]
MREITRLPKLSPRKPDTHKGDYGRVLVVAGSVGMTGAAYLCSKAALRSGAGIVTLGTPESLYAIMSIKLTCCMVHPLPETDARSLSDAGKQQILALSEKHDVVAVGPGISLHPETKRLVLWLLQTIDKPIVLDADGINAVDDDLYALESAKREVVLTPHPGEMARLGKFSSPAEVQKNRLKIAMRFAQREGIVLVLKGHQTLVTDSQNLYVNTTGNPGMATAGAGDVLTGIIAGLIGQGFSAFEAAQLGTYIHGLAGDIAKKRKGEIGMIASDILDSVPRAFRIYAVEQARTSKVPEPPRPAEKRSEGKEGTAEKSR